MLSKIPNPLYYPVSVLVGGLALVIGIRFVGIPNLVMLPSSVILTIASATGLKSRELNPKQILKQQLTQQLEEVRHLSEELGQKTETLRQEASQKLSQNQFELDLLISVQEICDFNQEIPKIMTEIEQKFSKTESVLSIEQLTHQLLEVNKKMASSSGVAREQLEQLAVSLERNLNLAKTGEDTRQAQIFNLHRIIQDAAGSLQQLQNQLRNANLSKNEDIQTLNSLTEEIKNQQEQFAILVNDLM